MTVESDDCISVLIHDPAVCPSILFFFNGGDMKAVVSLLSKLGAYGRFKGGLQH